jgi:DNA-binding SARP family transcriptional activator/tetratricopeptide (TPR) repeat protein
VLEIRLLGQFDVREDGEPVVIASRSAQLLLAYLLLNPDIPHRREQLAGLLWPDYLETSARRNLRTAVWHIRRAIGERYLQADRATVGFVAAAAYTLDVTALEQVPVQADAEALLRAVSAYTGDLLPGFYEDWVQLERERLQGVFERRMQALLDQLAAWANWPDLRTWAEHWIAQGSAPEPAYRALMQAHAGLGNSASVAATYQRCVEALQRELGVEPSAQTRNLYERLIRSGGERAATTLFAERYKLEGEVGRGGLGVIYRAHDKLLNRPVAIKVLVSPDLDAAARARLLREAQASASLNHPNIVRVYDAGEAELPGRPGLTTYIALEFVEGQSLRTHRPVSLSEILAIARQLCAALEHAHAHQAVHRNLKPENVIVTPQGTAKLMDFGMTRSLSTHLASEAGATGTVSYLAPEIAAGRASDGSADLYALGVLLYELITRRLPFVGEGAVAVISQHMHAPVVPPSTYYPQLPADLEALILRLLAKHPEARPASVADVLAVLECMDDAAFQPRHQTETAPAAVLLVLEQIVRGRLVGRHAELQRLHELWARAQRGQGNLALLSGEPGIGKTRLARELMVYAQLRGAVVLAGGCYEYEAGTPYLPFIEALRGWAERLDADALRQHLGASAPELARLVPEIAARLGALAPNPTLAPSEERLRLFDNLARFLQSLAGPNGLLLFLDDLHWADQDSLALLHYLLRRLRTARMLVVAAYREVGLDRSHRLSAALVEWTRERLDTHVPLTRLSAEDSQAQLAALLGDTSISPDLAEAIHQETEGNPFFVEEVVKSLVEQGILYRASSRWERQPGTSLAIPQSIKAAVGRRLSRLSLACIDTLYTAAAMGKLFAFNALAAVVTLDEARLLDAIDEAVAAQLIRPEGSQGFAFTHDKIREVLYEDLNAIRRRLLHCRIGTALEHLHPTPEARAAHTPDLAFHFGAGGDRYKALQYDLEAAEQARRLYAHEEAARHYQHAREQAQALNLVDQAALIDEMLGDVQHERGAFQRAVHHYQRALTNTANSERSLRAVLNLKLGETYQYLGDPSSTAFLHNAERELDPHSQADELANAIAQLGRQQHFRGQLVRAIEHYQRALSMAERFRQPRTLLNIYAFLAGACQHLARFAESDAWAQRCVELGEQHNLPIAVNVGYVYKAESANCQGLWAVGLEWAGRAREIAEKIGAQDRLGWCDHGRAEALYGRGDLPMAHQLLVGVQALSEQVGEQWLLEWTDPLMAWIEADLGRDEAAYERAGAAQRGVDSAGHLVAQCFARHALAYYHVQRGEWAPAAALYDACAALWAPTDNRLARLMLGPNPALAKLKQGLVVEAAQEIAEYLRLAESAGAPHWIGCGRRVEGLVLAAQGQGAAAMRALDESVVVLERNESRLQLARSLYERARLQQDAQAGHADLQQALGLFEACGAARDCALAAAALSAQS